MAEAPPATEERRPRRVLPWLALGVVATELVAGFFIWRLAGRSAPRRPAEAKQAALLGPLWRRTSHKTGQDANFFPRPFRHSPRPPVRVE
jgi:hypothetical protein